jgi:GTP cyclohydrolase I
MSADALIISGITGSAATTDIVEAAHHARSMLRSLGIPCENESTIRTPERLVRALTELTSGRDVDPAHHLETTFPPESDKPAMIIVPGIRFVSLCEHHMLPWVGTATTSYLPAPGARIVGLSKLPRLVKGFAARPQVQERLGEQIVNAINAKLTACIIHGSHSCMSLRGVRANGAHMVTSHLTGQYLDDPAVRAEFRSLSRIDQVEAGW